MGTNIFLGGKIRRSASAAKNICSVGSRSESSLSECHQQHFEKVKSFFMSVLPFPKEQNWKQVKIIYTEGSSSRTVPPELATQFRVIDEHTDLDIWWKGLEARFISEETGSADLKRVEAETYLEMTKFLLHEVYIQNDPKGKI